MTGPGDQSDTGELGEPIDDDERWLRAREEGSPLPSLPAERAAAYEALTEMVRARGRIDRLPSSSRDELRAALVREEARRRRATRLRGATAVATVAGAAIAIAIWPSARDTTSTSMIVAIEVNGVTRAASAAGMLLQNASVNDRLIVDASHAALKELRVYRDDRELVARCPGHAGCTGGGTRWKLRLQLDAPGRYRAIRVDKATADPGGEYDVGMAALRLAGAELDDKYLIIVN